MNSRHSWVWLLIGALLFAAVYFFEWRPSGPSKQARVLPNLKPSAVTSVQVRPAGPPQLAIRAERTDRSWQLEKPIVYPAEPEKIQRLLEALSQLFPALFISPGELRGRPNADEEYGFAPPQASVIISQGDYRVQLNIGSKTVPGDQVFLQVVGVEGVYVVDAGLLQLIPREAGDWRDTTLLTASDSAFDRLAVTNNARSFSFVAQRDGPDQLWRLVWPFTKGARADNRRLEDCLQKLATVRISGFISDDPKASLETFGLAPAQLELGLGHDATNFVFLQFGQSPTNDPAVIYARRDGQHTIFTVPKELLAPWQREVINDFRDPHLLTVTRPVERWSAQGQDKFSCERDTNGAWRILPEGFPADTTLVADFLSTLTNAPIIQFVKDVVNAPDLPAYGLGSPLREYVLETAGTDSPVAGSNAVIAALQFGLSTNQSDRVFARRSDESSVYAVGTNDFFRLPAAGWQLRERQFWDFPETNVMRVTIRQQDKVRGLVHNGPHQWSLASGSSGVINDLAVEETVRGLAHAAVLSWVARGETNRVSCGFAGRQYALTFELRDGGNRTIEFGNETRTGSVYVGLSLSGSYWIGDFPDSLYAQVVYSLTIP
jgi:hypothetical protein